MSVYYGYLAFLLLFSSLLIVDFSSSGKKSSVSAKGSALITLCWIGVAALFGLGIYVFSGKHDALLFVTGYLIEFSLSIDNVFVFMFIFERFNVSDRAQRRILTIGVLSAIVMRFVAISFGIKILESMSWLFYVFGAILIYGGLNIVKDKKVVKKEVGNITQNILGKFLRITQSDGDNLIVKKDGKIYFTELFIALVLIEKADIIFAVDSIPIILSITRDIFIVFTSNMFAILGMRSIYFLVSNFSKKFIYVRYGLAVILVYMGVKMICAQLGLMFPPLISICVILFSFLVPIYISFNKRLEKNDTA